MLAPHRPKQQHQPQREYIQVRSQNHLDLLRTYMNTELTPLNSGSRWVGVNIHSMAYTAAVAHKKLRCNRKNDSKNSISCQRHLPTWAHSDPGANPIKLFTPLDKLGPGLTGARV